MKIKFADCELDIARRVLCRAGSVVSTEPQVFDLLVLLAESPDRVVPRDEIVEVVWGGRIVSESAISARIAAARKAVGDDGKQQAVIRTISKRGLQLAVPVSGTDDMSGSAKSADDPPRIRYTRGYRQLALAYAISGSGPPVVRCHPSAHLEAEWHSPRDRALFAVLSQGNTLIRYDHMGAGMSDRSVLPDDLDDWAENLRAVADAAGLEEFALVSETGGVHSALRFAARYPDRLSRLVIIGGYVDGRARRLETGEADFLRNMIRENWQDEASGLRRAFAFSYYPDGPLEEVETHNKVTQAAWTTEFMILGREIINNVANAHLLPLIRCPTLIVHARFDAIHPLSEAQKLAAGITNSELLVLETANHLPMSGHPSWAVFARALREFLDGDL